MGKFAAFAYINMQGFTQEKFMLKYAYIYRYSVNIKMCIKNKKARVNVTCISYTSDACA